MSAGLEASPERNVDLKTLVGHRHSLPATTLIDAVQTEFTRLNVDFLAVMDGEVLKGIVAKREVAHTLGSRFGFALNARRVVSDHLMTAPLRITDGHPITEVFTAAAARSDREFYDDVLLVDAVGAYLGLIPMQTLVRLQTQFLVGTIARVEESRQEVAEKNRQMEEDLQMAREVQLAMLPQQSSPLSSAGVTLRTAHRYRPAGGVSGDFFDVLRLSEHAAGILVCDVMGHGVRSALITAMVRAMIEELRPVAGDPGVLLTQLNRDLTRILRQTGSMIFVTAAYVVVHLGFGRLRYAQAGHPTPLRWDAGQGKVRRLGITDEQSGPALGMMDEWEYATCEETLGVGERVVLFTDGLVEAAAGNGEEFGEARLVQSLERRTARSLDEMLGAVLAEVTEFSGGAAFADDVCIVAAELDMH
ncbi:MAG TPA: SpoIIE family protein phosphatase [Candidatus Didemnitutus sp.]|nr:SpoIIE family protein phosphatase [Candidatus Didemnitutus sp.]